MTSNSFNIMIDNYITLKNKEITNDSILTKKMSYNDDNND